jgi:methyl-accepting chemotaxis protein
VVVLSLFRKLVIFFGLFILVILSATLAIVYNESRRSIEQLSQQKAVSIIQTIDSALESHIPDAQFEDVLLHLKSKDPHIISFDIYKLNQFLYDIASTDPNKIGTQSNRQNIVAVVRNQPLTSLHGDVMEITAPIHGYGGVIYSANVRFSIADDLKSTHILLVEVLLIGLCALVLSVLGAWLFTREFLSKPVLAIISAANNVASGTLQVDLSKQIKRRDEFGHLARSFQRMTESLHHLMSSMAETASELNREFEELVSNGDYAARGALHVSDTIQQVVQSVNKQLVLLSSLHEKLSGVVARCTQNSANPGHGSERHRSWSDNVVDDLREWMAMVDKEMTQTKDMMAHLEWVLSSVNGQLGALQHVNHTAAQLSQIASELRNIMSTFEI